MNLPASAVASLLLVAWSLLAGGGCASGTGAPDAPAPKLVRTAQLPAADPLVRRAQDAVRARLKTPSVAGFPDATYSAAYFDDGSVMLRGNVDSQNSYGATMRGRWIVSQDVQSGVIQGASILER